MERGTVSGVDGAFVEPESLVEATEGAKAHQLRTPASS